MADLFDAIRRGDTARMHGKPGLLQLFGTLDEDRPLAPERLFPRPRHCVM